MGNIGRQFGFLSWYQRVHLSDTNLALGNVISSQNRQIKVWNGYVDRSVSITAVSMSGGEGIDLSAPAPLPLALRPLQARNWLVSVSLDGPPTVQAAITWTVTGEPSLTLTITGSRITAWGWTPDWTNGVQERLEWLTDVLQSPTAAEQRRKLRQWPRRSWSANLLVDGDDRASLDLALYGWGQRNWALPIWTDVTWLSAATGAGSQAVALNTAGMDYRAGGLALLRGATALEVEVVEVDTVRADGIDLVRPVQTSWAPGSRIYPVRIARLSEQPQESRLTDQASRYDVSFDSVEACSWPATPPTTLYRGVPVLEEVPDESEDLSRQYQRLLTLLDNGINAPAVTDLVGTGIAVQQHRWFLAGRAARSAWRSLAYYLAGRAGAIWVPTFADDLRLTAVVAATAATLDIKMIGYARFGAGKTGRRHIRIELFDGRTIHRRITGAVVVDAGTERLSLDLPPDIELSKANVRRISWLQLMRLQDDAVEIDHVTDVDGLAKASAMLRSLRDDLELQA
ncbi:hypothetical protein KWH04_01195 [Xanthomonas campestris pv. trichodesmae]|uniref:Phage tail protein n=2 Tax=Xanthomonas citri TaxID=346 RepID=A0AB33C9F7_XANCI|nr:hypothetical protein [Xanthomonas citri]ASK91045.1 hypothetical protein XcvCFBP7111P_05615 [Xanthomonas citri pv. vignicola]MBV6779286.1 hypothetical protein [Xanthomonas campestris pv. trichodesmae]MBZ3921800.1 hypothetical protein [Xanthomonas campestris pv. trichodesmae]MBZ3926400.1 hypothetical protein [Xanthomonas citri pv. sesbaniae]